MWEIKKLIKKGAYTYALVPDHPYATKNGYVLHHRIVMENHLGRLLNPDEVVHHKNHNKQDNRLDNLEVLTMVEHAKLHQADSSRLWAECKCPVCGKVFHIEYRQLSQVKFPDKPLMAQCCSRKCGCTFGRLKQLGRITHKMEIAISENILRKYRKFRDNSEVTVD